MDWGDNMFPLHHYNTRHLSFDPRPRPIAVSCGKKNHIMDLHYRTQNPRFRRRQLPHSDTFDELYSCFIFCIWWEKTRQIERCNIIEKHTSSVWRVFRILCKFQTIVKFFKSTIVPGCFVLLSPVFQGWTGSSSSILKRIIQICLRDKTWLRVNGAPLFAPA